MRHIAELAGVSVGTVSRVYNGNTDVAADLVENVLRAAKHLGYAKQYSKNNGVRAERELGSIGYLLVDSDAAESGLDPYQQNIVAGIEKAVSMNRGHLILARTAAERGELPAMLTENMVRGIIVKMSAAVNWPWIEKLHELVPMVLVMSSNPSRTIPSVSCDNQAGTYQTLKYLRELGHDRIGFLCVEDLNTQGPDTKLMTLHHQERLDAFKRYAPVFGCIEHPSYIQLPTRDRSCETLTTSIEKAVRNYVALGSERPTALICATDIYAFAFYSVASKYNIAIPQDMSVVGFMNTEAGEFSVPLLTSVSLSEEEVARTAVQLLQEYINHRDIPVRHVQVATRLVERLSCQKLHKPQTA